MPRTSPSPSHHSRDRGRSSGFYRYGDNISGLSYHTRQFSPYIHGGLNIAHPKFPQEAIPRGVHRENIHQNHPYYSCPSMPTHPHQSMSPHPHHNMPPHIYQIIVPHQVVLCPYFTSTPMYTPYLVPHYPRITPLGYLHTSYSRLSSSVLPPHSKIMSEYIINRRGRRYN